MASSMRKFLYRALYTSIFATLGMEATGQNIISIKDNSALSLNPGFKETDSKKGTADNPQIEEVPFNLGLISFSTKEKKLELNHYSYFVGEKTDFFFGVSAAGEIKNSITSIFSSKNIVAGGDAKARFGVRLFESKEDWGNLLRHRRSRAKAQYALDHLTKPASDLWLIANAGFSGSSFKLYLPDTTFASQIQKQKFTGIDISAGLNFWTARIFNTTLLTGVTFGYKQTNNFEDDLTESVREDTRTVIDSSTNTTRKVIIKETVYSGSYKEKDVYPLNFDLYFVPHRLENLGFLAFSTTDISKIDKPKTKVGFGIFFLKKQNAFNPVAGVTFDYADVFDVDPSDDMKGASNKFSIAITTRITLVNNQKRN